MLSYSTFKRSLLCLLLGFFVSAHSQINPANITIARDSFGVPHIFAPTDAEVAYGLAWAHCEDDFKSIQENLLPAKGMLGRTMGKEGVLFDYGMKFFGLDTFVQTHYESDLSDDFKKVITAYIAGVNAYAAAHPGEVLVKHSFPFTPQDAIMSFTLNTTLMSGAGMALKAVKENRIKEFYEPNEIGSNAMAIAPSKTEDGKTYLLVNSHQPIEGRFAWYEAHLCSQEGWNIIGGLFPGGATIFVGSNQKLGWAHTNNYHTTGDIYKLKVKGNRYWYDGAWHPFATGKVKLRLKLGGLQLGITKKLLNSAQGPVFKTKHGYYALRFPGASDLRAPEQWYRMNKAQNFAQFEQAIKMQAIPLFNIIYGDADGTIFWQSGGIIPIRPKPEYWKQPLDGTTSAVVWQHLLPYEKKPSLLNPECGYVFNCNETPFNTSGEQCNWQGDFTGCQRFMYNRGERLGELFKQHPGKISWQQFYDWKFDKHYCRDSSYAKKFAMLYNLDAQKYPDIADCITRLKNWDLNGDVNSLGASLAMLVHERLLKQYKWPFAMFMIRKELLSEADAVNSLRYARHFLMKTHGTIDVKLGDLQRLIRGNVNLPASGLREVLRAADPKLYDKKKGIYRIQSGDGYIQLNKYSQQGAEVFSVNAYGASAHAESPHYTDQMEMFEAGKFKQMSFDKNTVLKTAERIYHPGLVIINSNKTGS